METTKSRLGSIWALRLDLLSAKVLVWVASLGRDAELTPDARMYFADRYRQLAQYHRKRGRPDRATRLEATADAYHQPGGDVGGPPYAAAMAMPRPDRFIRTRAVSGGRFDGPDDAA